MRGIQRIEITRSTDSTHDDIDTDGIGRSQLQDNTTVDRDLIAAGS